MIGRRNDLLIALLADGPSDRVLLRIISWCIRELDPCVTLAPPHFRYRGGEDIGSAVQELVRTYHPHLVFVHRDAERVTHATRKQEIPLRDYVVPVVPVRMTEAWLLTDEKAIRKASGNPNGRVPLSLPSISRLESIPDPKTMLRELLVLASELNGRRQKRLRQDPSAVLRVADYIPDFRQLRQLPAFADFESALRTAYPSAAQALEP
jgi:hypothetical protein